MRRSPIHVTFFTAGSWHSPSSRYRSLQFFPYLRQEGIAARALPLQRSEDYLRLERLKGPQLRRGARALYLAYCLLRRLAQLGEARESDLIVVEHELFTWMPFGWEKIFKRRLDGRPYMVDYDDASYVKYRHVLFLEKKIPQVMGAADLVTVGSPALRDFARQFNPRVELLPTVVDLKRYTRLAGFNAHRFVVGWIGGPQNARHLKLIAPALQELARNHPVTLKCVGAPPHFTLPGVPVEVAPWSWETELEHLLSFDVGISPLENDPFSQGKCGFKLIQYMACGLPVVASPVGAQATIIQHGMDGFLAEAHQDWLTYLTKIKEERKLRVSLGRAGRKKVERHFCVQQIFPKLRSLMFNLAGN